MGAKRMKSKPEPPKLVSPPAIRASDLRIGDEAYVVLSYPLCEASVPGVLSKAEREITAALLAGDGYAQIAARRGTAVRTVANQVASIFRKVGVCSRLELAVRLQGG